MTSLSATIAALEPTFHPQHPWCGQWTLAGRPAFIHTDAEWVEARMPVCGDAPFQSQFTLPGLAKLSAGDFLRIELPVARGAYADTFRLIAAELERALDHFEGVPANPAPQPALKLADLLAETSAPWTPKGDAFTTPLDDDPAPATFAIAEPMGSAVAIRTTLTRLHQPAPDSLDALTHFLLALNQRIRLARGSIAPGRAVLEVVLPAACATPALVTQAVNSLWTGTAVARRECAALLDPQIAEAYLQFHLKGAIA